MISTMGDGGRHDGQRKPHNRRGNVRSHEERSDNRRQKITDNMFDWMGVDGRHPNWCRPLVVFLMNMAIEHRMVQQPESKHFKKMISSHSANYITIAVNCIGCKFTIHKDTITNRTSFKTDYIK